jgi:thiol-disulfide isomerase/thioredoxin
MSAMICRVVPGVFAMLMAFTAAASAIDIRPFDAGSMAELRAQYAGRPFVLAFWSTTCEPCRREMSLWRALKLRHPAVPVVLVAADPPGDGAAVRAFLLRFDPGPVEHRMFADPFAERVRYAVDKRWRGELPRTYFFDAAHVAEARSGLIERRWAEQWFRRHAP